MSTLIPIVLQAARNRINDPSTPTDVLRDLLTDMCALVEKNEELLAAVEKSRDTYKEYTKQLIEQNKTLMEFVGEVDRVIYGAKTNEQH